MCKKIIYIVVLPVFFACIIVYLLMYFTKEDRQLHYMSDGNVKVQMIINAKEESEKNISVFENKSVKISPGKKSLAIKNTGSEAIWVKLRMDQHIERKGDGVLFKNGLLLKEIDSSWAIAPDSSFYYKYNLLPDKTTPPVFESIETVDSFSDSEGDHNLHIVFTAYAVNSKGNGSTVWEAKGWHQLNQVQTLSLIDYLKSVL